MSKINARNNDLLKSSKAKTSPQIYSLLVDLVNEEREDLAEIVLKIDYLLQYTSTCIKHRDFEEAKDSIEKARVRLDMLNKEKVDTEHLEHLYQGIKSKIK